MSKESDILDEINKLIEDAAIKFNAKMPALDAKVFSFLQSELKNLDTKDDKIAATVKNLRLVGSITKRLLKIIVDKDYKKDVEEYLKAFNKITTLQNQYFNLIQDRFKPTPLLQAIRQEAISLTLDGLTNAGLAASTNSIKKVLQQNITTGGSYKDLMKTLSGGAPPSQGPHIDEQYGYSKVIKTMVITSIAQYSRQYAHTISEGLNFEWFQYVGSTIVTTRCFCHAMVKKRYFHRNEIPDLLSGEFEEFIERECVVLNSTKLPEGFIKGTNASNFMTYAGGWNCQHSIFPVPESRIPKELRDKFKPVD